MSELKEKVRRTYRACEGCKKVRSGGRRRRDATGRQLKGVTAPLITASTYRRSSGVSREVRKVQDPVLGVCTRDRIAGSLNPPQPSASLIKLCNSYRAAPIDLRSKANTLCRYARRAAPYRTFASLSAPSQPPPPTPPAIITHPTISRSPSLLPTTLQVPPKETTSALHHDPAPYSTVNRQALSRGVGAATDDADDRVLLSSTLRNPSDALRMLVEVADSTTPENSPAGMSVVSESSATAGWSWWAGIKLGLITQGEAEYLLGLYAGSDELLRPSLTLHRASQLSRSPRSSVPSLTGLHLPTITRTRNNRVLPPRCHPCHLSTPCRVAGCSSGAHSLVSQRLDPSTAHVPRWWEHATSTYLICGSTVAPGGVASVASRT